MITDAIVTIDGPSGVGKGTLAQYLCCKTGFHLLDSGAIYRTLAYGAVEEGIDVEDISGLVELAENLPVEFKDNAVLYKQGDVTKHVRTETVAAVASKVAAISEIRTALLKRQRNFAQPPGLVADGRDMGTVVFPQAPVKLFLNASAEERAKRRVNQLKNQGIDANIRQIARDIMERDERDRNRKTSPLIPAENALEVDTTELTIAQVCEIAMSELHQAGLVK